MNELRTYQGQSNVFVTNELGSVTAMTFGGGANALVTELLGEAGSISSDFGGNPPYEKMYEISRIVYKHWLDQSNVLFIIGGKANNTDIYTTFRAMAEALRDYFNSHVYSGGNVVCGTMPGRSGAVLKTELGDIPVYNSVVEALEADHHFNVAVVHGEVRRGRHLYGR